MLVGVLGLKLCRHARSECCQALLLFKPCEAHTYAVITDHEHQRLCCTNRPDPLPCVLQGLLELVSPGRHVLRS